MNSTWQLVDTHILWVSSDICGLTVVVTAHLTVAGGLFRGVKGLGPTIDKRHDKMPLHLPRESLHISASLVRGLSYMHRGSVQGSFACTS